MKFLVDEQLPGRLVHWLIKKGFDAVHATSLATGLRIPDWEIAQTSMLEERIVISKDIDFFNRFVLRREPYKLIYLTTGNISNNALIQLFEGNWPILSSLLHTCDVVEMSYDGLLIRF